MEEIDQVPTQLLAELRAVLEFLEAKAVIQHIKQKLVGFRERPISTFGILPMIACEPCFTFRAVLAPQSAVPPLHSPMPDSSSFPCPPKVAHTWPTPVPNVPHASPCPRPARSRALPLARWRYHGSPRPENPRLCRWSYHLAGANSAARPPTTPRLASVAASAATAAAAPPPSSIAYARRWTAC